MWKSCVSLGTRMRPIACGSKSRFTPSDNAICVAPKSLPGIDDFVLRSNRLNGSWMGLRVRDEQNRATRN